MLYTVSKKHHNGLILSSKQVHANMYLLSTYGSLEGDREKNKNLEWQIPVWQHCEMSTITAKGNHCCYKTSDGVTLCPNNLSIIFRGDFTIMNLSIQISMVYQL